MTEGAGTSHLQHGKATHMTDDIGEVAGRIWHYLNENGEVTTRDLMRAIGGSMILTQRAIGWLAREDKIVIWKASGAERIKLR